MSFVFGATTVVVFGGILGISILLNLSMMSGDKKIPAIKEIRKAHKKGLQLAFFHHPEGYGSVKCIEILEGSNQLDLPPEYGIVFRPISANQSEALDKKVPTYHYIAGQPYPVNAKGVAALSKCKDILAKRNITSTPEKLTTLMHRNLSKNNDEIRQSMVPGSKDRIPDDELNKIKAAKNEMAVTKIPGCELFVFAEAKDFLHGVGMSAAVSLREWKSYIISVERGGLIRPSGFNLDGKQIAAIVMALAIGYAITQSVNVGALTGGVGLP